MVKNKLEKLLKGGLLVTIGDWTINFPVEPGWDDPDDLITEGTDIINILMGAAAVVAVAVIIIAGYTLITSAGDPDKIQKGQKTLTAAIVGFIVVMIVALIIRFVLQTLGVD